MRWLTLRDGVEGLRLAGTSPDAIAEGLRRFLALDEARRGAMREAARSRALADFSLAAMVARTCAVWERVLAR